MKPLDGIIQKLGVWCHQYVDKTLLTFSPKHISGSGNLESVSGVINGLDVGNPIEA